MSQSKIYVGNLSYNTTEDELRDYFAQYGHIEDIKLIIDFNTGRSKGFGFITFGSDQDCENALAANGVELSGRKLKVNIARDDNRTGGGAGRSFGAPSGGARRPNRSFRERDDRSDRG
jgi:RNA recognition motif-containing protein